MPFKVEAISPEDGVGFILHNGVYYRVCLDDGWKPRQLEDWRDVASESRYLAYFQAVEGVVFESLEEAIEYIRNECRKSLPELKSDIKFVDIMSVIPMEILEEMQDRFSSEQKARFEQLKAEEAQRRAADEDQD